MIAARGSSEVEARFALARRKKGITLGVTPSAIRSAFSRDTIGITDPQKVLCASRHAFKDRVTEAGASEAEQKQLMGHAEAGMSKRYGTKAAPKPVDIVRLDQLVQSIDWSLPKTIRRAAAVARVRDDRGWSRGSSARFTDGAGRP